jgi:hypothetical protein
MVEPMTTPLHGSSPGRPHLREAVRIRVTLGPRQPDVSTVSGRYALRLHRGSATDVPFRKGSSVSAGRRCGENHLPQTPKQRHKGCVRKRRRPVRQTVTECKPLPGSTGIPTTRSEAARKKSIPASGCKPSGRTWSRAEAPLVSLEMDGTRISRPTEAWTRFHG